MSDDVKDKTEVRLGDVVYLAYIKEVATKTSKQSGVNGRTTKAFIKKVEPADKA